MKRTTDFARYLTKFLSEYLPIERNMSANTIASYRDTFVLFINFMKEVKNTRIDSLVLKDISKNVVIDFLQWLDKHRSSSISTRNNRLAAIHSFIQYLQYEDIANLHEWQRILSIKHKKTTSKGFGYLSVDAIKLLLEQPDTSTYFGRRDLTLLTLMYDTGARVQEIIDLTPSAIRITDLPYTICITGKGRKSRIQPLMKEQVPLLKHYMEENHLLDEAKTKAPLFFNKRGEKFSRMGVSNILKKYIDLARLANKDLFPEIVSCHSLRHSKAMHLLQAGVNIVYIRDFLGHSSIQTTEIYARADSKQKREALEKVYENLSPGVNKQAEWEQNQDLLTWLKNFGR